MLRVGEVGRGTGERRVLWTGLCDALSEWFGEVVRGRSFGRSVLRRQGAAPLRGLPMRNLARGLAHEIRNPLNSLSIRLQLLKEDLEAGTVPDRETLLQEVERLCAEVQRLERIVDDFHRFARLGVTKKVPVDLAHLLDELVEFVGPEAEQLGIRIRREFHPVPEVFADPVLLRQAFLNLIVNAFQAMEDGGELTVAVEPAGDRVMVRIADTGSGIPEEVRARIFEPFFSTKPEGTGLGLAVVQQVVALHQGTIQVKSRPGQGTEFCILLPVREG